MADTQFLIRAPRRGAVLATDIKQLSPIISDFIASQTRAGAVVVARSVADYLVGDGTHGLKHYPPYKYITRRRAYGKPFVSDRQRSFVMANIRSGKFTPGYPRRTEQLQRAWKMKGKGTNLTIYNDDPAVLPVMGDFTQSNHERLVGWRMVSPIIESNLTGALRQGKIDVKKFYASKNF